MRRRILFGTIAAILLASFVALPQKSARAQTPVALAMFYYGGFTDTIRNRLVAHPPKFVVLNTPGGSYRTAASPPTRPNAADIAALHGAGISVISYINTGNMVNFRYAADSPPSDRAFVRTGISNVAAEGCDGVFFDEGGVGNWRDVLGRWTGTIADRYYTAPAVDMYGVGGNSWSGYTINDYLSYTRSFGMIAVLGTDFYEPYPRYSYGLSTNVFPITDYILTDEAFFSRAPEGSEIGYESQCWVIGYALTNATDAASYTSNALNEGFAASYHCASYGSLMSWYETYYGILEASGLQPPTNVLATDGTSASRVTVTWTKSANATGYRVYRDGFDISGALGDVATFDDVGAGSGSIGAGSTIASDGASASYVSLFLSGTTTSHGPSYSYKVKAFNGSSMSSDSVPNTGYMGIGSLTYQWQRSAADSNASYSNLPTGITAAFSDTTAPIDGVGRYYRCVLNAAGASQAISTPDRGFRLYSPAPTTTVPPVPTPSPSPSSGGGGGGMGGIALFIFGTLAVIFVILEPSGTARDALGRFTKR